MRPSKYTGGGGVQGGAFFKEISLCVSVTSRLASVTFKMASKVFVEEMDQKLEFCTDKLFQFLTFGILTLERTRGRGVMVRTTPHKVFVSFFPRG